MAFLSLVRTGLNDTRLMISGALKLVRDVRDPDPVTLSMSLFLASSATVKEGMPAKYQIALANMTQQHKLCKLVIDLYLKDDPTHPQGHYGFFEKMVVLEKLTGTAVDIEYDWDKAATVTINGAFAGSAVMWRGPCSRPGTYRVSALLFDHSGSKIEDLYVIQELRR